MTHKSNLRNILQNGLLSHNSARAEGHMVTDIADGEVNARRQRRESIYNRSLHDYVPLYFNPKNPMLFRRREMQDEIIVLAINRSLLLNPNAIFTDGNAASSGSRFYRDADQLRFLNWNCINGGYWNDFEDGKRIRCAEVLIYPRITAAAINKIYFKQYNLREYLQSQLTNFPNIGVEQKPDLYF
jgi:hypothetical protein